MVETGINLEGLAINPEDQGRTVTLRVPTAAIIGLFLAILVPTGVVIGGVVLANAQLRTEMGFQRESQLALAKVVLRLDETVDDLRFSVSKLTQLPGQLSNAEGKVWKEMDRLQLQIDRLEGHEGG